jgi:hypothetical protein
MQRCDGSNWMACNPSPISLAYGYAAVLTHLPYSADIAWAPLRSHSDSAVWERIVFGAGALMLLLPVRLFLRDWRIAARPPWQDAVRGDRLSEPRHRNGDSW